MSRRHLAWAAAAFLLACAGCGPNNGRCVSPCMNQGDGGADDGGGDDQGTGGDDFGPGIGEDLAGVIVGDPTTCAEASMFHTYVGCDYWPTVVANPVWSVFDYAVVVSNPGTQAATVTVTGPGATNQTATVQPNTLAKITLPWVPELKGADFDACTLATPINASVTKALGAYHLVSTVPVIVYQFNALEYKGGTGGQWATCPGTITNCKPPLGNNQPIG